MTHTAEQEREAVVRFVEDTVNNTLRQLQGEDVDPNLALARMSTLINLRELADYIERGDHIKKD